MRLTWFTAFNALFEVSLRRNHVSSHHVYDDDLGGTHDKHQKIVITLSANSYASRWRFPGQILGLIVVGRVLTRSVVDVRLVCLFGG
jgi:hypothetical protein